MSTLPVAYRWIHRARHVVDSEQELLHHLRHTHHVATGSAGHTHPQDDNKTDKRGSQRAWPANPCERLHEDRMHSRQYSLPRLVCTQQGAAETWGFAAAHLFQQRRSFCSSRASVAPHDPASGQAAGQPQQESKQQDADERSKARQQAPQAAPQPGPVLSMLPPSWLPYAHLMRLDKPIGTWLLAWPCEWRHAACSVICIAALAWLLAGAADQPSLCLLMAHHAQHLPRSP
jgi:hypothetical protein